MSHIAELIIEEGPDKGKKITVTTAGVRLGRSSRNDVVLTDPSLSRFHCRLFFKPGQGLFVTDLGSANQTMLNDKPIQEAMLSDQDVVTVGDTLIRAIKIDVPRSSGVGDPVGAPAPHKAGEAVVDLGFKKSSSSPSSPKEALKIKRSHLIAAAALMLLVILIIYLPKILTHSKPIGPDPDIRTGQPVRLAVLELRYEKVIASQQNISRYFLTIDEKGKATLTIDNLGKSTAVPFKQETIERNLLQKLAFSIEDTGFFSLNPRYEGRSTPGIHELYDMTLTIGQQTHRTIVLNKLQPDEFKRARQLIEEFISNAMGIIEGDPEVLTKSAMDAFKLGKQLYDERNIRNENLALAIKSMNDLEGLLNTVEPKPDFYAEALALRTNWKRELQDEYDRLWFLVTRATNVKEWAEAAEHLQVLTVMIIDQKDDRYKRAYNRLLEVERQMQE